MLYISKYKCRYCGEVFEDQFTGDEKIAFRSVLGLSKKELQMPMFSEIMPHFKPDHYGVGDLIGVEKRGDAE